jgi:outer membrane protein assembly factor BamB
MMSPLCKIMTARWPLALPMVLLATALSACGTHGGSDAASASDTDAANVSDTASARTPEAYCEAFYSRAAPLHDEYATTGSDDVITGLLEAVTAPGRLSTVFADMAHHAPGDIDTDTEAVRDAFKKVQDSVASFASSPLDGIIGGTIAGAAAADSLNRVSAYLQSHCPLDSAIARKYVKSTGSTSTTDEPSPSGESPAAGTQLAAPAGDGAFSVVTNIKGDGFTVVRDVVDFNTSEDSSTVTTYAASGDELAEIPAGSLVGDCQAVDVVRADGKRVILTISSTTEPAEGVKAASGSSEMDAWDAATGDQLWTAHLADEPKQCDRVNGSGDGLIGFAATPDGKWGLLDGSIVIDLATGATHTSDKELHVAGNVLVIRAEYSPLNSSAFDPETVSKIGTFDSFAFYGYPDIAPTGFLETDSDGSSPPAGSSEDGSVVFGVDDGRIIAYGVPAMTVLWRSPKAFNPYLFGEAGGVLLTTSQDEDSKLVAFDVQTGKHLWSQVVGDICGFTASQLLMVVNGQLATLDTKTGKQLSYDADTSDCPDLRAGGIGVQSGSEDPTQEHGVTITQVLEP